MADISHIQIGENVYSIKDEVARAGGGGGGGGGSDPDGTTVINRNASGDITSMVLTYDGGVRTTTFSESGGTKTIVEEDVKTGATTKSVRTTTITDSQITQVTTEVPVS